MVFDDHIFYIQVTFFSGFPIIKIVIFALVYGDLK